MTKIRVTSDGTPEGTKVLREDGTDIGAGAYTVQVNIGQEGPPHVVLTFLLSGMDTVESEQREAPINDPVAAHRARRL